jgi:hypothetical protein
MFELPRLGAAFALALAALPVCAQAVAPIAQDTAEREGQHDFDFEFGTWTTHVRVLRNPLTGDEPEWAEYQGTSVFIPVMEGRAHLVELSVDGPAGRIEGISLRLYNPQTRQWNLNYAGLRNGLLTAPVYGGFGPDGRGVFHGQDMLDGRAILVRFEVMRVSEDEARFEQAFSADGGSTWEVNWIATDTRQ